MGYFTDYTLKIDKKSENTPTPEELEFINFKLGKLSEYQFDIEENELSMSGTWYDFNAHMVTLSKFFPKYLFFLEGIGEATGDEWRMYYMDGKTTKITPIITWPEFEKEMLN
jgi:hypothetical protein